MSPNKPSPAALCSKERDHPTIQYKAFDCVYLTDFYQISASLILGPMAAVPPSQSRMLATFARLVHHSISNTPVLKALFNSSVIYVLTIYFDDAASPLCFHSTYLSRIYIGAELMVLKTLRWAILTHCLLELLTKVFCIGSYCEVFL